jgi:hypothetical protein
MPLPTTGPISLGNIATEFGDTPPHSMSEFYGAASGIPVSGAISIGSFYGAASNFVATITSNVQELNLRTWLISLGWNQTAPATVTIASGVYVWSDNTSVPALNMGGSFPGGLTLINNGYIIGKGGNGGYMVAATRAYVNPTAGGPAIALTGPISIDNTNGYIGGGGGGGSHFNTASTLVLNSAAGGGGAGGGMGGAAISGSQLSDGTSPSLTQGGFGIGGALGQNGTWTIANNSNRAISAFLPPGTGAGGGSGQQSTTVDFSF